MTSTGSRERFETRVRRNITDYALALAEGGEERRKNGIILDADEFTTRDAEVAALAGNHMRAKARQIVEALTAEGMLEVTRIVSRGNSNPWVIRRASAALKAARSRELWEASPEDEDAFREAITDEDARACARVLRSIERKPTIEVRLNAQQTSDRRPRTEARAASRESARQAKVAEARRVGHEMPDDVPTYVANRLMHDPPGWLWSMGEPVDALRAWERTRDDWSGDARDALDDDRSVFWRSDRRGARSTPRR